MHVIEDMHEAYRRAQKYLQTEALNEAEDLKLEFKRQLLYIVGYSKEEVEAILSCLKRLFGVMAKKWLNMVKAFKGKPIFL